MSVGPRLLSIGTATPAAAMTAPEAQRLARRISPEDEGERLDALYRSSGVERRAVALLATDLAADLARGGRGPSTAARLDAYEALAPALAAGSAARALAHAEKAPESVTHLITVSCTGARSPGVDHALIERLGFSRDISRTHIGFMGCHGAINGLAVASSFARSEPSAVALVVCVELCSLHYHVGGTWDQQVANAIFADGSASAVVGSGSEAPAVRAFGSRVFPGTAELMRWEIGDHGFEMGLSPRVPALLRRNVGDWVDEWLARQGLSRSDIGGWAIHPGGPDILEAVRQGLRLPESSLGASHEVLRRHGNMSSGTVLWVMDALLRSGVTGPIAALSFGPGLSGEAVLIGG